MHWIPAWCATAVLLAAVACAPKNLPTAPTAEEASPAAEPSLRVYRETGTASWYGKDFQGRATASGEIFDMAGFTAAHRTLPLGTVVRVTNLDNFKSVEVRVNDRGPLVRTRIIELSYGAAKELGFLAQGTARVKIEAVESQPDLLGYTVLAASYVEEENAAMLKARLGRRFERITIVPFESNVGRFYRVRVGIYPTEDKADRIAAKLALEGLEPIVMRLD